MIGTKIALVGAILLVVGAAMYFIAQASLSAADQEKYNLCNGPNGADLPECNDFLRGQSTNPVKSWGFIIAVVGVFVIVIGILTAMLLGRKKVKVVKVIEKVVYKCPKCGFGNDEDAEFCKKCGEPLKKKPEEPLKEIKAAEFQ